MLDHPTPTAVTPDARGRYVVYEAGRRLGVLKAVLSVPRLLLLDAPQSPGGTILVPFDAIEQIDVDERTIRLSPGHDVIEVSDG